MSKKNRNKEKSVGETKYVRDVPEVATAVAEPPEEPANDGADDARPEVPEVVNQPQELVPADATDPLVRLEALQAEVDLLKAKPGKSRVATGSKPRPNVIYTLLERPPKFTGTPQVGQLINILFDPTFVAAHKQADGSVKVPEPELFEQIKAGHAAGVLRTRQEPVRIFSYYRSNLLHADAIRWE
jgi:hypothetical protein